MLDGITKWMAVNSEGIYATKPWNVFGDGPGVDSASGGGMNERNRKSLTAADVRFTTKGNTLYTFVMGWPEKEAFVPALAQGGKNNVPKIANVELLGHKGKLTWTHDATGLKVQMPDRPQSLCASLSPRRICRLRSNRPVTKGGPIVGGSRMEKSNSS